MFSPQVLDQSEGRYPTTVGLVTDASAAVKSGESAVKPVGRWGRCALVRLNWESLLWIPSAAGGAVL